MNAFRKTGLLVIILLAFVLRLINLGADSLWYDETVSTFLAGQPAAELIAHTARDIHPPGYYLLLRGWLLLTGYPAGQADPAGQPLAALGTYQGLEFAAAFFSLCLGVLLIPLTWQLARRLRLPRPTPLLAALLAAVSPFGVWYGQEVRMYTLSAALGLVCLLAAASFLDPTARPGQLRRAALVYALAAATGLYTLYYFAFLLIAINLALLPLLLRRRAALITWLAAQTGGLLLYLPWLPTAWRQATSPPVPPWRSAPHLFDVLLESWTALSFGQSADPARFWPLLLLTLGLVVLGIACSLKLEAASYKLQAIFLATAAFGPLALILLVSAITPLYHVRYLFTYSPAFSILLALGLAAFGSWRKPLGRGLLVATLLVLLLGSSLSLRRFWSDPQFTADDLRSAVRELAERWRPGDAILVNAGYAYPALLTYWPEPPAWHGRLSGFGPEQAGLLAGNDAAVILQTGHVDGDPDLGWGDPRSDFYALPADTMRERLAAVAAVAGRLWQLRIYDTVNDPQGLIRQELQADWTLFDERGYPGEAHIRVQGFWSAATPTDLPAVAQFDGWLDLHHLPGSLPPAIEAGQRLDVRRLAWSRPEDVAGRPVSLSLRLADGNGEIWAQQDEPIGGNVLDLRSAGQIPQPASLTIPAGTPPGEYDVLLIAYDPQTGQPLPVVSGDQRGSGAFNLGPISILRPAEPPAPVSALADFGPLRLVEASTPATAISPGDAIPVSLLWQAAPDFSGEELVVVLQLLDKAGNVAASLEAQPRAGRYPSSTWQPGELVRVRQRLGVPAETRPGDYRLIVGLYRASDGRRLQTPASLPGLLKKDYYRIKEIELR